MAGSHHKVVEHCPELECGACHDPLARLKRLDDPSGFARHPVGTDEDLFGAAAGDGHGPQRVAGLLGVGLDQYDALPPVLDQGRGRNGHQTGAGGA